MHTERGAHFILKNTDLLRSIRRQNTARMMEVDITEEQLKRFGSRSAVSEGAPQY